MKAVRIAAYRVDKATGRVYVRVAHGEDGSLPVKAREELEFASMEEFERQIAERDNASALDLVLREMAKHRADYSSAVGLTVRADGVSRG